MGTLKKLFSICGSVKTLHEPYRVDLGAAEQAQDGQAKRLSQAHDAILGGSKRSTSTVRCSTDGNMAAAGGVPCAPDHLARAISSRRSAQDPDDSNLWCRPEDMIGDVRELRWVGQGSQGVVFEGYFQGASVAVKWCIARASSSINDLCRELLISGTLGHPNVVQTFSTKVALLNNEIFVPDPPGGRRRGSSLSTGTASDGKRRDSFLFPESVLDSFGSGEGFGDPCPRASLSNLRDVRDMLRLMDARPGQYLTQQIMEYCDQGSLLTAITHGVFSPSANTCPAKVALRALYRTAREVAQGMLHLHQNNIVHGDLKPANVLLTSSRRDRRGFVAKVSDFGLAAYCSAAEGVQGAHWGTMVFMSPERFNSNQMLPASDVWSFGVLMWQMFTMKPPYKGARNAKLVQGIMNNSLFLSWPADSPRALVSLVNECMAYEPDERPTFKSLVIALTELENDLRMEGRLSMSLDMPRSSVSTQEGSPAPNPTTPAHGAPHHAAMSRSPLSRNTSAGDKQKDEGAAGVQGFPAPVQGSSSNSQHAGHVKLADGNTSLGVNVSCFQLQSASPQSKATEHMSAESPPRSTDTPTTSTRAGSQQHHLATSSMSSGINQGHVGSCSTSSSVHAMSQGQGHDMAISAADGLLQPDHAAPPVFESDEYMSADEQS